MTSSARTSRLHVGDVVYFDHIHLDTAKGRRRHSQKENTYVYDVEAKPRPMLVLFPPKRQYGIMHYMVVRFTTKGLRKNGTIREGYYPFGNHIDPGTKSYLVLEPSFYPENLVCLDERYRNCHVESFDHGIVKAVIDMIRDRVLRSPATAGHAGGRDDSVE